MDKRGELQSTLRIEDVPTVRSMVAQKLREAIMSGTLKPGQRLIERELEPAYAWVPQKRQRRRSRLIRVLVQIHDDGPWRSVDERPERDGSAAGRARHRRRDDPHSRGRRARWRAS